MKEQIQNVIDNGGSVELPFKPLNEILEIIKSCGLIDHEYETNGWQVDFSFNFEHQTGNYVFSGSLWYGGFVFSKL